MQQNSFAVRKRCTVLNGASDSDVLDMRHYSFGQLFWPAALDGTTIGFTVCDTDTGTFVTLVDDTGTAIALTFAAGKATALPVDIAGARYMKIHTNSPQTADRSFILSVKP